MGMQVQCRSLTSLHVARLPISCQSQVGQRGCAHLKYCCNTMPEGGCASGAEIQTGQGQPRSMALPKACWLEAGTSSGSTSRAGAWRQGAEAVGSADSTPLPRRPALGPRRPGTAGAGRQPAAPGPGSVVRRLGRLPRLPPAALAPRPVLSFRELAAPSGRR